MELEVSKRPDGKLDVRGLVIWSTGTFHGYGSPPEGDTYTEEDLDEMVRAHAEVGDRIRPKVYPGHKLNPLLKLLARPKGEITRIYREGNLLKADITGMDPEFFEKIRKDGARISPDVRFNYVDPETGRTYEKMIVGVGVLGAAAPANSLLPPLDSYATNYYAAHYGDAEVHTYMPVEVKLGEVKSYADGEKKEVAVPSETRPDERDEIDVPKGVYLLPKEKKFPVKRKVDGEWKYSKADLRDAIRLALLHYNRTKDRKYFRVACKAKAILEKEFGAKVRSEKLKDCGSKSYTMEDASMNEKDTEVIVDLDELGHEDLTVSDVAAYAEALKAKLEETEKRAQEAEKRAEEAMKLLQAQIIEAKRQEIGSYVDGLVKEMRIPPAVADKAKMLLEAAAGMPQDVASYSLGEVPEELAGKTLFDMMKEFLAEFPAPKAVDKSASEVEKEAKRAYADPRNLLDPENGRLLREQVEEVAREKGISYADALKIVLGGNGGN